jgi:hypothetical protein
MRTRFARVCFLPYLNLLGQMGQAGQIAETLAAQGLPRIGITQRRRDTLGRLGQLREAQ